MISIKDEQHITVKIAFWISTGGGAGLAKKAPGTVGTLVALFLTFLVTLIFPDLSIIIKLAIILITVIAGYLSIEICKQTLDAFTDKDPQKIVIDEIAGYFTAILFCSLTTINLLLAFGLFRIFDITKPWLVGWADSREGSFAIILDDLIAK